MIYIIGNMNLRIWLVYEIYSSGLFERFWFWWVCRTLVNEIYGRIRVELYIRVVNSKMSTQSSGCELEVKYSATRDSSWELEVVNSNYAIGLCTRTAYSGCELELRTRVVNSKHELYIRVVNSRCELDFRTGFSISIFELNFRAEFSSWIFELYFRTEFSSWIFELNFWTDFSNWIFEIDFLAQFFELVFRAGCLH